MNNNGKITLSHSESLKEQLDSISEGLRDGRTTTVGGKTARDLGMLCTSPNINQQSKNKPFCAVQNRYSVQTENDRKRAAYGYYWFIGTSDYTNAPAAHTPIQLIEQAKAMNGKWKFKPLDGVYRAWDFDGYNHLAKRPYIYENFNNSNAAQVRTPSVYHQEGAQYVDSISLSDMPHPNEGDIPMDWQDFHIVAIACWNNNTQYLRVVDTGKTVSDLDNPLTLADAEITLPALLDGSRVYDFIWAATNVDVTDSSYAENEDQNLWVFLPESYATWLHTTGLSIRWDMTEASRTFEVDTDTYGDISYMAMRLVVENNYSFQLYYRWHVDLWSSGMALGDGERFSGTSENAVSGLEIVLREAQLNELNFQRTPEGTMLALSFSAIRTDSDVSIGTYHFDPINNIIRNGEATTEDGHSVRDIMNALNI